VFNVALIVHGEEALLAVGFIFAIHFFNGHLRPGKFPMDLVIFTGVVREDGFRDERPLEARRLEDQAAFETRLAPAPTLRARRIGRAVGTVAVGMGLLLVVLIGFALTVGTR
jgi:hypothetical protein